MAQSADPAAGSSPPSRCPRCGKAFVCGVVAGEASCWCMRLPPGPPLPRTSDACYCPDCLAALRAEQLKPAG